MRRSLPALIIPLSVIAACEASRPVEPPRRPAARAATSTSVPSATASASASSSSPVALVAAADDPLAPLPPAAIARCGTTRMRLLGSVESVAVTDDGKVLSVESESSYKLVKDLIRGTVLHKLPSSIRPVLSHDGSFVVAAMQQPAGEIAFIRASDGQRLRTVAVPLPPVTTTFLKRTSTSPARVDSILVSGDDKRVVVVTSARAAHVLDVAEGKLIASFPFEGDMLGLDRTGSRAIAAKSGRSILSFDPTGWFVIELTQGKVLRRYEPKPGTTGLARDPNAPQPEPSFSAAVVLSSDGKTVYAKEWNELWSVDVATGAAVKEWEKPSARSGGLGAFGSLGSLGFTSAPLRATPRGGVAFVDDSAAVEWSPGSASISHLGRGQPAAFSPSGEVALLQEGHVVEVAGHDTPELPDGHSGVISSLAFLGAGQVLVTGGNDLRMWKVPGGKPLAKTSSHGEIRGLAGSADGSSLLLQGKRMRVVSASGRVETLELKESVARFDIDQTGRRVAVVFEHWETGSELALVTRGTIGARIETGGRVHAIAFSPSGESIASLEEAQGKERTSKLVIRDSNTLQTVSSFEGPFLSTAEHLAFAGSDKRVVVSNSYRGAMLFDLESKQPLRRFSWGSCCDKLAVSRDGNLIAGSSRESVAVWETGTRKLVGTYAGHSRRVTALAFSPDGRVLASGSEDTTALLWDVSKPGAQIPGYEPHALDGPASARSISRGSPSWYVAPDGKPLILQQTRGKPVKLEDVEQIVSSLFSSCALHTSGRISCWGWTWGGALGIPEERANKGVKDREVPVQLSTVPEARDVGLGEHHGCALTRAGAVWCWGTPSGAKLSAGEISPHPVPGTSGSVKLAVSSAFACAARQDGKIACWGTPRTEPFSISASPTLIDGVQDAISVVTGDLHACALRRDGRVSCWGANQRDQLGNGSGLDSATPVEVNGVSQAVQLESSSSLTCARTHSNAVWCWGGRSLSDAPAIADPVEIPHLAGSTDLRVTGQLACGDTAAGLRCIKLL